MDIGISTSCFYPMTVEDSLKKVCELGAPTAEIFMNSTRELEGSIMRELIAVRDFYGIKIRTLHPFTSAIETVLLFSEYDRRTEDGIDFYRKYFQAAAELGAEAIVLHGCRTALHITPEAYAEAYVRLAEAAREYGVFVAHENVREHHCAKPGFMKRVADLSGDLFRAVLDIKQCRRSGVSEFDFIDLLGDRICQVHLSDVSADGRLDCTGPGDGVYDFVRLFDSLRAAGYDKSAVIELYSGGFGSDGELKKSMEGLKILSCPEKV